MRRKVIWGFGLVSILVFVVLGWGFLIYQGKQNLPVSCGKEDLIRLHVIANSDSVIDQQLKLRVRDEIIVYLAPYLEHAVDKANAKMIVLEHQNKLISIAEEILARDGVSYPVDMEVGIFDFPIKAYGSLVLPAGKYEAVRILLGKAEGKNWWCVLFPPLCFIDITNAAAIPAKGLVDSKEQQDGKIEFRLKIAELWEKI